MFETEVKELTGDLEKSTLKLQNQEPDNGLLPHALPHETDM